MQWRLLLFLVCCPMTFLAQTTPYTHLTTENGLSNNFIRHVVEDREGFLWIATLDGLSRFDGEHFLSFRTDTPNGQNLPSNRLMQLLTTQNNELWIATEAGLAVKKQQKIEPVPFFGKKRIDALLQGQDGQIWVIAEEEVFVRDTQTLEWQKIPTPKVERLNQSSLRNITINDTTYVALVQVVFREDGTTATEYLYFWDVQVRVWKLQLTTSQRLLHIRENGDFMVSRDVGGIKVNKDDFSIKTPWCRLKEKHVLSIPHYRYENYTPALSAIPDAGSLIVPHPHGISIFAPERLTVKAHLDWESDNEQHLYPMNGISLDQSGNLWIYTVGDGLYGIPKSRSTGFQTYAVQSYQPSKRLSGASVRAVYQHTDSSLWVGTYNSQDIMDVFDADGNRSTLGIKGIGMSVYPDRYVKDQIWVGAFRRLHRVDAKTRLVTQTFDIEERLGAVWSMTQLTDSSLICGTTSGIFRVFPEDNNIIQLDSTECRYVYQDKQKRLWLSMHEEGLFQWENGERKYVGLNTKNTNPVVKCVFQDQKERIWVATDKGLIHFIPETGKTTHYTRKEGLPNNLVYGILEDQQGYLWLSTNLGLSRFDPENKTFDNFDVQDGLQDNEFNTVSFYGNPQTGELFFGGIKGLNRFFPESLQKNRIPPKMALTDYKRLGKSVKLNTPINQLKTIKLPESEAQMLSFEFVALSLFKGIKNRYSYRLEGINKDWIELGTNNELTLTNITAGNYTLYIRGSNNHGIWTEEPIKIDLKITPPFYKTPLFIFLVVSVILLSAFALYRLRTHRARQQERKLQQQVKTRTLELAQANQAKDKLLALIAHDIRGPLTAFGSIGQQLEYFLNKNRPDRIRELGQHIQGSAKDLNHLLDRLLNWALIQNGMVANQPELLSVKELFDENIGHYQSLLEVNDIRIKREEKSDLQIFGNSNGLHTILRNLIGNAIKYSPNGSQITLRAFKREKRTYIEVQDYGIGMSPKVQEQLFDKHELFTQEGVRGEEGTGLGLLLVIDFVRMNKGNIRIESELEKGTCIYLDFPSTKS